MFAFVMSALNVLQTSRLCLVAGSSIEAGHYLIDHMQIGTSSSEAYRYKFYREVFVDDMPSWSPVATWDYSLTGSIPEFSYYEYDVSGTLGPGGGNQYSNVLIEILDLNNNVVVTDSNSDGSIVPTWVP
ncbi:MAG: hypothetical protein R3C20_00990 [Planctomycetaceae bacterium]